MSDEDWRVKFELADESLAQGLYTAGGERELAAHARKTHTERAALSLDGPVIFAYAKTREDAEAARQALTALAHEEGLEAESISVSRWHDVAEKWEDADAPLPVDSEELAAERAELLDSERGDPDPHEWEVRVTLPTHRDAVAFADTLAKENIPSQRHAHFLLLGARNEPEANELADRVRNEAPVGTEVRTELTFSYVEKLSPDATYRRLSPFVPFY